MRCYQRSFMNAMLSKEFYECDAIKGVLWMRCYQRIFVNAMLSKDLSSQPLTPTWLLQRLDVPSGGSRRVLYLVIRLIHPPRNLKLLNRSRFKFGTARVAERQRGASKRSRWLPGWFTCPGASSAIGDPALWQRVQLRKRVERNWESWRD